MFMAHVFMAQHFQEAGLINEKLQSLWGTGRSALALVLQVMGCKDPDCLPSLLQGSKSCSCFDFLHVPAKALLCESPGRGWEMLCLLELNKFLCV